MSPQTLKIINITYAITDIATITDTGKNLQNVSSNSNNFNTDTIKNNQIKNAVSVTIALLIEMI